MALDLTTESYISVKEADQYWEKHGDPTAWSQATIEQKESALRYATRWIDTRYEWQGTVAKVDQVLQWPRMYVYDIDNRPIGLDTGGLWTVIPQQLKEAVAEVALSHVRDYALNQVVKDSKANVRRVQAGSVSVDFDASAGGLVPPSYEYIDALVNRLATSGGAMGTPIMRS